MTNRRRAATTRCAALALAVGCTALAAPAADAAGRHVGAGPPGTPAAYQSAADLAPSGVAPSDFALPGVTPSDLPPSGFTLDGVLPSGVLSSGGLPSSVVPQAAVPSAPAPSVSVPLVSVPAVPTPRISVSSALAPSALAPPGAERVIVVRPDTVAVITGDGIPYRLVARPGGANQPRALDPDRCVLYPSVVYKRKSSGYQNVGFKPYTKCARKVTSIRQTAQAYKYHDFGLATEPVGPAFSAANRGEASLTQRNIGVRCTNLKSTTWFGITTGVTVEAGRTYESAVHTADAELDCGT